MNRRQTIPKELRYTVENFHSRFPNDDACLEQIKEQRLPGGVAVCHKCEKPRKHYRVRGRTAYACETCGNHIFPLAGTIFEKTSTSLRLWFYAMYLMGSTRCGISAKQIQRETGVTYHGGRRKGEAGRMLAGNKGKNTRVIGVVERKGRIKAQVAPDLTMNVANTLVKEYVLPETMVYTDESVIYGAVRHLEGMGYEHKRINHSQKVYVAGDVHTNTIEGFWSLVKRGIGGVYHSVSAKYLQSYLDEYSFRYNRRDSGNLIFAAMLERASETGFRKPSSPA